MKIMHSFRRAICLFPFIGTSDASPIQKHEDACQRTKVVILGAGIAGITAAQALHNQSISDFIILEYQGDIGGRIHKAEFGRGPDGKPYTVEYGANWAQGLGRPGGPENPVWTFEKKWNVANTPSNTSNVEFFNELGRADFGDEIQDFEEAVRRLKVDAGEILAENLQDRTVREGLSLVGWKPQQRANPAAAEAAEWWLWDGEQATTPEESSLVFGAAVSNFTFGQFSEESNFVIDQRGHNTWLKGEASTFLKPQDPRLKLNRIVTDVYHSNEGVIVETDSGGCVQADYAICTFSLGVLQHDNVAFEPALPKWKKTAIEMFHMSTYTKIFMQFDRNFWGDKQFFLYADPVQRGWYPIFQSLDAEGFFPGSHILFVTVTQREAYRVERQSEEATKAQVMEVLRNMFPKETVPDPIAFAYPRWSTTPWAYGSYSNWPPATSLDMHQNLRANVDRLWFAGEHTSASHFGYMQGAWFEGQDVGNRIGRLIQGNCAEERAGDCGEMVHYDVLRGTTPSSSYGVQNGWPGSSMVDG
ncbi:amine oxidase [Trichodelitschia bisporula]|uniref:Amine oxidase n=1 Tax=Trichodelitschia bisporula TaxID=703511 RepID=A0A6G1HKF8_9PEZI|nr:amine oxidase [Trichodelitschia bisporula]